jgi:hypothetical protein
VGGRVPLGRRHSRWRWAVFIAVPGGLASACSPPAPHASTRRRRQHARSS